MSEHLQAIHASGTWGLRGCQNCHGADFAGGRTGVSCRRCHTSENGPANCVTCHGNPPVDNAGLLFGMPSGAYGAHQHHVVDRGYACTECHAPVTDLTHTGPLPAAIEFSPTSFAQARGYLSDELHLGDAYSGNATCAVYCHSNGKGTNFSMPQRQPNQTVPLWTSGEHLTCTSCHSIPPAYPHVQVPDNCHGCHSNVDPAHDYPDSIRFINPQLHVNGHVELG